MSVLDYLNSTHYLFLRWRRRANIMQTWFSAFFFYLSFLVIFKWTNTKSNAWILDLQVLYRCIHEKGNRQRLNECVWMNVCKTYIPIRLPATPITYSLPITYALLSYIIRIKVQINDLYQIQNMFWILCKSKWILLLVLPSQTIKFQNIPVSLWIIQ